jgi:hypothetical protein
LSTLKLKENCKAFDGDFALRIGRPGHLLQAAAGCCRWSKLKRVKSFEVQELARESSN